MGKLFQLFCGRGGNFQELGHPPRFGFFWLTSEQSWCLWVCHLADVLTMNVSLQFSSVTQLCPALCDPVDCSMAGFPVHHQLLELTQSHVHRVCDAIQPSHPLSSPSPPAFDLSQHQGFFPVSQFFASGGQSIGVSASTLVLPMNFQD